MAQLRQKLPREAVAILIGLTAPVAAWARLDERYGNREMSVIAALKRLKGFKSSKATAHDKVMEIATAVQRCSTVLAALGQEKELLRDRETLAEIIQRNAPRFAAEMVPPSTSSRRGAGRGKAGAFMSFLEDERAAAVVMHLDALSRKPVGAPSHPPASKPPASSGGTDQGLYGGVHSTQQVVTPEPPETQVHAGGAADPKDAARIAVKTAQDARDVCVRRKANLENKGLDKCPLCKKVHTFEKTWTQVSPPAKTAMVSTQLASCPLFLALSPDQKAAKVTAQAACPLCTSWEHSRHKFSGGREAVDPKCKMMVNGAECGGKHGKWFHPKGSSQGNTGNLVTDTVGDVRAGHLPGLYEVYSAEFRGGPGKEQTGTMMIDNGSDTNYVRHAFALAMGLRGEPHVCRLKVVDTEFRLVETAKYRVRVVDTDGTEHEVIALGLDSITTLPPDPDLSPLIPLLGEVPLAVLDRPQGRVDVLIGLRDSALHGRDDRQWGNLRLLKSRFGCGWAIRGTHESLSFPGLQSRPSYSASLHALCNAEEGEPTSHHAFHVSMVRATEFQELNELGTTPAPACSKCAGCADCLFRRKKLSKEEQEVVARVEATMKVDDITRVISCVYPWKPCVSRMKSNRQQAQKIQESMERHMVAAGTHVDFVKEMNKSIEEGKVREIGEEEMIRWHGPTHYVTVFGVIKTSSVSTKTRIVSNSALRNPHSGLSLNQCMWPGPNALADLLDCLLFWRSVEVALMLDLQKAYQSVHTSTTDLHLRRFLFRTSPQLEWRTFGYTRANFGDVAAGLILEVAKRRVADIGRDIDPQAAEQLETKTYVDDAIMGGSAEEVARMRGDRQKEGYSGTVARILSMGSMKVKFMAVSGSDDAFEEEQLGGKCLGVLYNLKEDEIIFRLAPCFYPRKATSASQVREMVMLDARDVGRLQAGTYKFTRRHALSMVMGLYDPMGLISPALVSGKLLLRRLYSPQVVTGWDQELPREEKQRWASWFRTLLEPVEARFPRSTRPKGVEGSPRMVGFCDAAAAGMCAAIYVVWPVSAERNEARLMLAKCRVAPLLGMTIPRGELQSLTILTRMLLVVAEAYPARFQSISTYTDSMCSLGALCKTMSALRPYFSHRVSEIHQIREQLSMLTDELAPVHHIQGTLNPADQGTRGNVSVADLGQGSRWQTGPDFLCTPYEQWPVTLAETRSQGEVPRDEVKKGEDEEPRFADTEVFTALAASEPVASDGKDVASMMYAGLERQTKLGGTLENMVKDCLSREKLELSVRSLARVLKAVVQGEREACRQAPSRIFLELSVQLLIRGSSASARLALEQGKLQGLGAVCRRGAVWVQGRIRGEQLAVLLGTTQLPVIMGTERLAKSVLSKAHRNDHRRSPQDIAARSRRMMWIMGATRWAKTTANQCFLCRAKDRRMAKQQMGGLPDERTTVLAPFEAIALDLFGPFKVKDPANGRREFKCWIIAFVCLATKAASLLPCPGYSTRVFIETFQLFSGIYGRPRLVYTDHAPSIIKASETHDWDEIAVAVGELGTEWRLTAKGCSWRNGLAERLIRSARHTLGHELRRGVVMDFHQFGAALSMVASILNARPLSIRTTPDGDFMAIAPRDVLLGRAGKSHKKLEGEMQQLACFEDDEYLRRVDSEQAQIVEAWKSKWMSQVFPDLVPRQKWKQQHRNLEVGDIGLIKYEKKLGPDAWRMAKIVRVVPGQDGKVRTVQVQFRPRHAKDLDKPYRSKVPLTMEIGVQRFAVMLPKVEQDAREQEVQSQSAMTGNYASEMTEN